MSYWDSSVLLKLYVKESDSSLFEQHAASAPSVPITSRLAFYELRTVLQRKEIEGVLTAGAAQAIHHRLVQDAASGFIRVVEFSSEVANEFETVVIRCYSHTPPLLLRTVDGIHLASAIVIVTAQTEIIATDKRLQDAALLLGLGIFP